MSRIRMRPLYDSLSPWLRIFFIFIITLLVFLAVYLLALVLAMPVFKMSFNEMIQTANDQSAFPGQERNIQLYLQGIQTLGLFILPSLVVSYLFSTHGPKYLGFSQRISATLLISVVLASIFLLPVVQLGGFLNSKMILPDFLKGLENWLVEKEEYARKLTRLFMRMESTSDFFIGLTIVALLPALGEELFFRGILQQNLYSVSRSPHVAIVITALFFSALHLQFYGFLPRFLLGLYYGYLFFWTGSLWMPVLAHFVNNGLAVFAYYRYGIQFVDQRVEEVMSGNMLFGSLLLSIGFMLIFLFLIRSEGKRLASKGT